MRFRFFLWMFILVPASLFSQDAVLSQYNSFPLYSNMAMAGSKAAPRIVQGMRFQWLNILGGYRTQYLSYDQYSRLLNSGIGLQFVSNDEMNSTLTNNSVHLAISPHFPVGRKTDSLGKVMIKPAINFGYQHTHIDTFMSFGDMIDPTYGFISNTGDKLNAADIRTTDFGAGFLVYGKEFFAGMYFHHLVSASNSLDYDVLPIYTRMTVQGGYVLRDTALLGKFSFLPSFQYERQYGMDHLDLTLAARYGKFSLGTSYRLGRYTILLMAFNHKHFQLGYSYEVARLSGRQYFGDGHEMHMTLIFPYNKVRKKTRTLDFITG